MATRAISVAGDGGASARSELERCVGTGGVVLFGADTLYGLGCDPNDAEAIERIHRIKGRDESKPSAVMFFSANALAAVTAGLGERTKAAVDALLPGPVTLVLANPGELFPLACRGDRRRLGVRLIEGPLAGADVALFQTSANRSGEPPPTRFGEVDPGILAAVDLAIDVGPVGGEASTVVDVSGIDEGPDGWEVLRVGAVSEDEVARVLKGL